MLEARSSWTRSVEVFAASCTGCESLSRSLDLPLACVRVAIEACAALEAMNAASYGGAALWIDSFQPFEPQEGWRDWRLLDLELDEVGASSMRRDGGRLCLDLPGEVTTAGFEFLLHDELRRFRMDEVTTSPQWLIARSDAQRPLCAPPRYTLADATNFRSGTTRVDDIFVCEPRRNAGVIATAARRALSRLTHLAVEVSGDAL